MLCLRAFITRLPLYKTTPASFAAWHDVAWHISVMSALSDGVPASCASTWCCVYSHTIRRLYQKNATTCIIFTITNTFDSISPFVHRFLESGEDSLGRTVREQDKSRFTSIRYDGLAFALAYLFSFGGRRTSFISIHFDSTLYSYSPTHTLLWGFGS